MVRWVGAATAACGRQGACGCWPGLWERADRCRMIRLGSGNFREGSFQLAQPTLPWHDRL